MYWNDQKTFENALGLAGFKFRFLDLILITFVSLHNLSSRSALFKWIVVHLKKNEKKNVSC